MNEDIDGRSVTHDAFAAPSRRFAILPFWFLNGELDPDEMRWQLGELRAKGMQGVILHGRYGLEMPYLGEAYLDRIYVAVEEASRLGLSTWVYDEMNWPSGTADKRVLRARPDLAQRYLECVSFTIDGPWFMCLTGEDSRYLDFQRSEPVAAFATGPDGRTIDLTPNLSFGKVVPWEVPPGSWRLSYVVEKRAEYYIDAMDPEATAEFLRHGYAPYVDRLGRLAGALTGFYSDEPAMHYFLTAADNPIIPWTKNMFRRFAERNGYELRPRLADLFFDASPDSARVRFDYYSTTTELYSQSYYRQIHDWCRERGLSFVAHLLYEEWLRRVIRVEGNLVKHYRHMDVVGVDHLYPIVGTRRQPDQHVAIKVASSAAHQYGTERVICESFGGIFMDATMQRMKWIADWEFVLGANVLNPHGFHYTLEGARKRDWPPSMFYQYPWWRYYEGFNEYIGRLSETLTGGRHVAKLAVVWPINAMFATYLPQERRPLAERIESDTNVLTDQLLRLHHDFDYLDEDILAEARIEGGYVRVADEAYECLVLPPMTHLKSGTVDAIERLVASGGRALGMVFLPTRAFADDGSMQDVEERLEAIFGVAPAATMAGFADASPALTRQEHSGGRAAFVHAASLDAAGGRAGHLLREALAGLVEPAIEIENDELFSLHRLKDGRDVHFVVNPTFEPQSATVRLAGEVDAVVWDPTSGDEHVLASRTAAGRTELRLELGPVGSMFIVPRGPRGRTGERQRRAVETISLDGDWRFHPADRNALVIERWLALTDDGGGGDAFARVDADESRWAPAAPGAWAYQLGDPELEWPVDIWYRIPFHADHVPPEVLLVLDGFAGADCRIFLNGDRVTAGAARSPFDSEMRTVDLTDHVRAGRNILVVRLTLTGPTDGITDRVKLIGSFAVTRGEAGTYGMVHPEARVKPAPWTEQGYPFYSGVGVYRTTVSIPPSFDGRTVELEAVAGDDVVEVVVNDSSTGTSLWPPHVLDLTERVRPGTNEIEVRVANTLANLLNGEERPSGLTEAPRLIAY